MLTKTLILLLAGLVTAEVDIEIQKKYNESLETDNFSEFVTYFNGLNLTWTITEYAEQPMLPSMLPYGVKKCTSTFRKQNPIDFHNRVSATDLPENFDSRNQWPQCDSIRMIYNQGNCNSCSVFASIDTASDRTCIHKNINVLLSKAEGICIYPECVCEYGYIQEGFEYWVDKGLVTKQCKNYTEAKALEGDCKTECENPHIKYKEDKHFGEKIYRVHNDSNSIQVELVKNGPAAACMDMFDDFKHYKGGIYDHKYGKKITEHCVRIIGYGTEGGVDYWLVANSWGTAWGEEGFYRIKRFNGLQLENYVHTGLPKN